MPLYEKLLASWDCGDLEFRNIAPDGASYKEFILEYIQPDGCSYSTSNVTYEEAMRLMEKNEKFRDKFFDILRKGIDDKTFTIPREKNYYDRPDVSSNYSEEVGVPYFFEVCPVTKETLLSTDFRFALLPAVALKGVPADTRTFQNHFKAATDRDVVWFTSLSNDSLLICPNFKDKHSVSQYAHLSAFMTQRNDDAQRHSVWKKVSHEFRKRLGSMEEGEPLWLSTSGVGIYWLHVRLDIRPKYYTFEKYKKHSKPHKGARQNTTKPYGGNGGATGWGYF